MQETSDIRPETEGTSDSSRVEGGGSQHGKEDASSLEQIRWMADPPRVWRFSHKWLSKRLNCTVEGIIGEGGCGGCCISDKYWPPTSGGPERGYMCPWLGDNGCSLEAKDRPILCSLYPLRVSKSGTVEMYFHATRPSSRCGSCYGQGPPIIDSLRDALIGVIGDGNYQRVRDGVLNGRDVEIEVSYLTILQLAKEYLWATSNTTPKPRLGGPSPIVVRTKPPVLPRGLRQKAAKGVSPPANLLDVHVRIPVDGIQDLRKRTPLD